MVDKRRVVTVDDMEIGTKNPEAEGYIRSLMAKYYSTTLR